MQEKEYLTVPQAAEILDVSRTTVWRWIGEGTLDAYRAGPRTIRIRREALARLMQPAREHLKHGTTKSSGLVEISESEDIWASYNPQKAKAALARAAGILADVDERTLLKDIHAARRQRSRGRPA